MGKRGAGDAREGPSVYRAGLYKDDGEGPVGPSREAEVRDLARGGGLDVPLDPMTRAEKGCGRAAQVRSNVISTVVVSFSGVEPSVRVNFRW
jgi:hypothetical protein